MQRHGEECVRWNVVLDFGLTVELNRFCWVRCVDANISRLLFSVSPHLLWKLFGEIIRVWRRWKYAPNIGTPRLTIDFRLEGIECVRRTRTTSRVHDFLAYRAHRNDFTSLVNWKNFSVQAATFTDAILKKSKRNYSWHLSFLEYSIIIYK